MGDVFWDFDSIRDRLGDHTEPHIVAIAEVQKTLRHFVDQMGTDGTRTGALRCEYKAVLSAVGRRPRHDTLVRALIEKCEWTEKGAQAIVSLARQYGMSILRNALALAEAMKIEDGEAGL
jgi:hypothetical protein